MQRSRLLARAESYLVMGILILAADAVTGRYLMFPILFVVPVALSAWYCSGRVAYSLAVLLPLGRLLIAAGWEQPSPPAYILANALIRIAVLVLIAHLVRRTLELNRRLEQQVENLVKMCAWTRTVEYQGEWISFEEYLQRRFNIETTHGMSPAETERQLKQLEAIGPARPRD